MRIKRLPERSGSFPCRSGLLDPGYMKDAHRVVGADRHIFPGHEAFFAKPEADLIVIIALNVVEIPLPAGFAAQMSDAVFLAWPKASDTATRLVSLPFRRIETAFRIQWNQQVVTVFAVPFGMAFSARKHQADVLEFLGKGVRFGHGSCSFLPQYLS